MSKIVAAAIESSAAMTLRTNSTDRVTVSSAGLVGVGTTTPSVGLEVVGSIRPTGGAVDYPGQVSGNAILVGGVATPDSGRLIIGDGTGWKWKISNRTSSLTTDLVTFTDQGSVGIGVASPTQALDVAGSIKASTSLVLGSATMAVPTGNAPIFGARAWVVFDTNKNAAGTVESTLSATNRYIKQSGNIASVNRVSAGLYTITFTTAMPHADYIVIPTIASNYANLTQGVVLTTGDANTIAGWANTTTGVLQPYNKTTTGFTIHSGSTQDGIRRDPYSNPISVLVFA